MSNNKTYSITIFIEQIWLRLVLLFCIVCLVIFISGSILLNDLSILYYCLALTPPFYVVFKMRNTPYLVCSEKSIIVYSFFGYIKNEYHLINNQAFWVKNERIYYTKNKRRIKIKANKWFINKHDWHKVLSLYSGNENYKTINHLIED